MAEDSNTSFGIGEDEPATVLSPELFPPPSVAANEAPPKPQKKPAQPLAPTPPAAAAASAELETAKRLLRTSKNKIEELKAQVQSEREATNKVKHEFQRFTIRAELDRQQRESEILRLTEVNLKYQQFNVVSHDLQSEVESLRRKFERLEHERVELVQEKNKLAQLLVQEQKHRHEANQHVLELKQRLETAGPDALAKARLDIADELTDLRREFKLFKDLSEKMLEDKELQVQSAKTSSEASTELAYLRDVVLKYLASTNDAQSLQAMEAAIASVLRFNSEEVDFVREKRRSDAGWALTFKSSIGF